MQARAQKTNSEEKIKGRVALKGFFNIANEWGVQAPDQRILLGGIPPSTYAKYKDLPEVKLPNDMLERISYIFGIYKALRILFPSTEQAAQWVSKENDAYPFNGHSALDYMTIGRVTNLADVRRYLDWVRG
jgi:Antitoxin Xre/MbcA/ParS C-terminal toxin-binding domain